MSVIVLKAVSNTLLNSVPINSIPLRTSKSTSSKAIATDESNSCPFVLALAAASSISALVSKIKLAPESILLCNAWDILVS